MPSLSVPLPRPDYLTGELVISARLRVLIAVRERLGWHTLFACHYEGASGMVEALYVCLSCGRRSPCANARAAGIYELLDGQGPVRLRVFYWQPPTPAEAHDLREIARLADASRRWLVLATAGVALTVFSLLGPNLILLVAGGLLAVVCMNQYNRVNRAWLALIEAQVKSLSLEIAIFRAEIEKQLAAAQTEARRAKPGDGPPDA
jgi:hypothetical protein